MLGVLIFEFMTGSAPFEAPYPMQIYAKVLLLGRKRGPFSGTALNASVLFGSVFLEGLLFPEWREVTEWGHP